MICSPLSRGNGSYEALLAGLPAGSIVDLGAFRQSRIFPFVIQYVNLT